MWVSAWWNVGDFVRIGECDFLWEDGTEADVIWVNGKNIFVIIKKLQVLKFKL